MYQEFLIVSIHPICLILCTFFFFFPKNIESKLSEIVQVMEMSHTSRKFFFCFNVSSVIPQAGAKFQAVELLNKLLSFHSSLCQALQHEIAVYQNLLKELSESAQNLPLVGSIQHVEVDAPKQQVHARLQELQELAAARYELENM